MSRPTNTLQGGAEERLRPPQAYERHGFTAPKVVHEEAEDVYQNMVEDTDLVYTKKELLRDFEKKVDVYLLNYDKCPDDYEPYDLSSTEDLNRVESCVIKDGFLAQIQGPNQRGFCLRPDCADKFVADLRIRDLSDLGIDEKELRSTEGALQQALKVLEPISSMGRQRRAKKMVTDVILQQSLTKSEIPNLKYKLTQKAKEWAKYLQSKFSVMSLTPREVYAKYRKDSSNRALLELVSQILVASQINARAQYPEKNDLFSNKWETASLRKLLQNVYVIKNVEVDIQHLELEVMPVPTELQKDMSEQYEIRQNYRNGDVFVYPVLLTAITDNGYQRSFSRPVARWWVDKVDMAVKRVFGTDDTYLWSLPRSRRLERK